MWCVPFFLVTGTRGWQMPGQMPQVWAAAQTLARMSGWVLLVHPEQCFAGLVLVFVAVHRKPPGQMRR